MAIELPTSCPNYARCGATGHYYSKELKVYVRCPCMETAVNARKLGYFNCPKPELNTPLWQMRHANMRTDQSIELLRPHIAGVMLKAWQRRPTPATVIAMEGYRIVEILLQTDTEFEYPNQIATADLFILMLGFADPRNRKLVEMVMFVLGRRRLSQLPTWAILGTSLDGIAHRYESQELADTLKAFKELTVK